MPICAAASLALSLVVTRLYLDLGGNTQSVMLLRFAALSAMSAAWAAAAGFSLAPPARRRVETYCMSLAFLGAPTCYVLASVMIPVGFAALLFFLHPIITLTVGAALDRARPGASDLFAVALAFAGIAVALQAPFGRLDPLGIVLAVCGGACVTANYQWASRRMEAVDTRVMTLHAGLGALAALALYFAAFGGFEIPTGGAAPWLILVVVLASFNMGIILTYRSVREAGPVTTAMFMNLEPPLTILFAVILLDERLSSSHAVGGAMVLASLILARRGTSARALGNAGR